MWHRSSKATPQKRMFTATLAIATCLLAGCTGIRHWWQSGLKVGPNYCCPSAPVADRWVDAEDPHVQSEATDYSYWWTVFNDPVLDRLVADAYQQNLPLRIAAWRILEARAQRGIAAGSLFLQQQQMFGAYSRNKFSDNMYPFGEFPGNREYDDWVGGFDAAWELDIWGQLRRGVEAADANLDAQIESYDDVLVILQAEVAAAYIQMRTLEERLALVRKNIALQEEALRIIEKRLQKGAAIGQAKGTVAVIDMRQTKAMLAATQSLVPTLQQSHRRVQNALCLLLGVPPGSLQEELGEPRPIPVAPPQVAVGIPADLLRRRPDVRRAERQAAAQSARIGMATAELYPHIAITGSIALEAEQFSDLYDWGSIAGGVGPGFRWNILNYGRIRNDIRAEDARFRQAVINYQNTVLMANKEVEDAIVGFLREQERVRSLRRAVAETEEALRIGMLLEDQGVADFDYLRVIDCQRQLVQQQDTLAESRGKIAMNLVAVYKALGGGWRMRLEPEPEPEPTAMPPAGSSAEKALEEELRKALMAPLPEAPKDVPKEGPKEGPKEAPKEATEP